MAKILSGLDRYFTSPPHSRKVNLMQDKAFQDANQVFLGKIRKLRQDGLDQTKHKDAVRAADMAKLYDSGTLAIDNPMALQGKYILRLAFAFIAGERRASLSNGKTRSW